MPMRTLARNPDGTFPRNGTGGLGCCCPSCCPDTSSIEVVFSGVNWCACFTGAVFLRVIGPSPFAGPYSLPSTGAGIWSATFPAEMSLEVWSTAGCTGSMTTHTASLIVTVVCTDGAYGCGAKFSYGGADNDVFSASGGMVLTNELVCGTAYIAAEGGTATLTCIP